ncbi:MAG TPA: hypothetical protein VI233_02485 [Puia sp.]
MKLRRLLLFFTGVMVGSVAIGQKVQVAGTIYDGSMRFALQGVSVLSASGVGTSTDSLGRYTIRLAPEDSIYFSYLGRATAKVPVRDIPAGSPFDMSLDVAIDSLPAVLVRTRDYRADSLENRKEYQKVFNYGYSYVDGLKSGRGGRSLGVGIDLDLLFDGRKNRQMLALQKRLEEEEEDKYIDHKWNRAMVRRVTGLESPALDSFMRRYRPSKELIQSCETDYEFYHYIEQWAKYFREDWKDERK